MKKRLLSTLLALALCLSLVPTTALAAGSTVDVYTTTDLRNAVRNAGDGDTIRLQMDITFPAGNYEMVEDVYQRSVTTTLRESHVWERWLGGWDYYSQGSYPMFSIPAEYDPYGTGSMTYTAGVPDTKQRPLEAYCGLLIENKNLTIDLNGHGLTGGAGGGIYFYSTVFVTGNSHVTIQGNGRVEADSGSALTAYGGDAKVTINGGHFKGAATAVSSVWNAEIAISGGTFEGPNWTERTADELIYIQYTLEGIAGPSDVGGTEFTRWRRRHTISGNRTYSVHGGALYTERNGRLTISGNPTIKAPDGGTLLYSRNSIGPGIVKIQGGTFEGSQIAVNGGRYMPTISGGTFTTIPDTLYMEDAGSVAFGTADGKYTVKPQAEAVATITSGKAVAYFTDLSTALSTVRDGETVTLLKDHSQPVTLSANSNYTLDLGGKTVSGSITASTGTVTLDNGTVEGQLSASGGKLSVIGGRYAKDPTQYVPEGYFSDFINSYYVVAANDNRTMEIWDADDLKEFADVVNGGKPDQNAVLMDDIDLSSIGNWTPIGNRAIRYKGTFDGNGHSISNLNINISEMYVGLFGWLGEGGVIRNVHITSGTIVTTNEYGYAGGIAGYSEGVIEDCSNAADVKGRDAGGIVADMPQNVKDGTYYVDAAHVFAARCSNSGSITGETVYGVGLRVHDSYNTGTLTGNLSIYGVGRRGAGKNCYNAGSMNAIENSYAVYPPEDRYTFPGNNYYLSSLSAGKDTKSTAKTADLFKSGEVAWLLNGGKDAPNGPYYQNLTGPNPDPYPVLDPSHAAVYKVGDQYVNYTYTGSFAPVNLSIDGGLTMEQMVIRLREQLPKTMTASSTGGSPSPAAVTWDTSSINYDPDNYGLQNFTVHGTAHVTGLLNGGDKPVQAHIVVKSVEMEEWTITAKPPLVYSDGGKLNLSSIKVTAKFANGAVKILEHDTTGVTFTLGDSLITNGATLDKGHHGQTLDFRYGGKTIEVGALTVNSTNNSIKELTVGGQEAQYENGGYAITLPPDSTLPGAGDIEVTLADPSASVTGKTEISAEGRVAHWEITVQAENGDVATYSLTVTVSPPYDEVNQTAVNKFTAAWNSLTKSWNPTQAEVQQDEETAGATYEQQLTFWLTNQLFEAGLNIPDNATLEIAYTSGPDWAAEGTRQDHDGTPGSFTFTATFTATAGEESQHKSVSFADNVGTITPTPYDAPAYTVNFDPQNGSAVSSVQVTEDTPIGDARPADPTQADHRFTGWFKEETCVTPWDFDDPVTENPLNLYAGWRWSQSETQITNAERTGMANQDAFNAGEYGDGLRMGDTVTITASATLTEDPGETNTYLAEPETFTFYLGDPDSGGKLLDQVTATEEGGVYTAELEVDLTAGNSFDEGQNTVYAVFSGGDQLDGSRADTTLTIGKAMFTVTFDTDGGGEIDDQYVEDGGTARDPGDPAKADYRFTGWTVGGSTFDFDDTITENTDLTANWEWAKSETGISFQVEQAGNPDAPIKTGVYHVGDSVSITATVTPVPSNSNGLSLDPEQIAFYVGDPENGGTHLGTETAIEDGQGGYTATLSSLELGTTEGLTDVGDYDIYAVFSGSATLNASQVRDTLTVSPQLHTVTFNSDGGSSVQNKYVEDGAAIGTLAAPTKADHRFTGWVDGYDTPYDADTVITGPVELTATWAWSKSETGVSIHWKSAGNPDAGESGSLIRMGDTVTVTASVEEAAQSNSMFLSAPEFAFYVGAPNSGTRLGTVSAQQTETGYTASLDVALTSAKGFSRADSYDIYAEFSGSGELDGSSDYATLDVAPAIYTVTFNSNGGTDVDAQYIEDGESIMEPADPVKEGSHFKGWTQNGQSWDFDRDTVRGHMTLTAQWSAIPVFNINGSVTDQNGSALPNVEITLQQGKTKVFTTKTDDQGSYTFERVTPGLYNVVAKRTVGQGDQQTEQTVTILVEITDHNAAAPTIKMPPENVNSVLELSPNAPDVVVDGLTEEAIAVAGSSTDTVTVSMAVAPKAPVTGAPTEGSDDAKLQQEQQAIQQQAASRTLDFLEIAVVKEVATADGTTTDNIEQTSNILEIAVEFPFGSRENVTVYRYHNGQAQPLTETSSRMRAAQDGTYYLDRANNLIHIFTQQFSLYAIGYTVPSPGGDPDDGGSSGGGDYSEPTYAVKLPSRTEGGAIQARPTRAERGETVTLTVKPDEGYALSTLTVTDSRGGEIDLKDKGDGKFTFQMPGRTVTVEAVFTEIVEEPQPWVNPFVDVRAGAWYYDAVRYVHEHGLMAGTSAKTFDPNVITTRGMIVTVLYRLAGCPDIENRNWGYPYADVDSTAYYGTAVYWARLSGIVAGYSSELFGPNDPITREQFAVMLYRFAGQPSVPDLTLTFSDADQVSGYASDAMRWAVGAGIISGKGNGILDPKGDATRAQAAAMLMRFCENIVK